MQFLAPKTLSVNLIYVAACYPVGTGMCHNMVGLLQHYKGDENQPCVSRVGSHVVFAWIHCTDVRIHCTDILIECR